MSESDPFERFGTVFEKAAAAGISEPNAMCLCTVGAGNTPSSRTVLLKSWDRDGFVFYTNLESRKARDIQANPNVSLTFFWREIDEQVHIRGAAALVSDAEADAYFATRPRTSQLGAWASQQSRPMPGRTALLAEVARIELIYIGRSVPRPPHWSGFRVTPREIEFWVAGPFRLHDRTLFVRDWAGWQVSKLYP
ncbi:MAG: pyridoxamine 5'-phosphate oxidase [Planctomycetes bacterium]|nr:pyridoxamine 5'-phosphate oxidase [Planctomycetota bacterium]